MWILVLAMYGAPPDAVDWDGPWTYMETKVLERQFTSEAECRNTAIKLIGDIHQGLLAPYVTAVSSYQQYCRRARPG